MILQFRVYFVVLTIFYQKCYDSNITESIDTTDLEQPTCSYYLDNNNKKAGMGKKGLSENDKVFGSSCILGVRKKSKIINHKNTRNIQSRNGFSRFKPKVFLTRGLEDSQPLDFHSIYLLSVYELRFDCQLNILKERFGEKIPWKTFNFRYLEIIEDSSLARVNSNILNIRKCYVSIHKIYRFSLLTQRNSLSFVDEDIGIIAVQILYSNKSFEKNLFYSIDLEINQDIVKLYCEENYLEEFRCKIDYFIQIELNLMKNTENIDNISSDMNCIYSNDFIKYWKALILELLTNKDKYIYIILPEFLSFEIKILENLNNIRLADGNYFLSILYLKFLLVDPKINEIKLRYNRLDSIKKQNESSVEVYEWFLNEKILLKKKFLKILEIFVFSVNTNLLYSVFYLAEKTIYFNLISKKFDSTYLTFFHSLNIFNTVIFQMDEITIKNAFVKFDLVLQNIMKHEKSTGMRFFDTNSGIFNPTFDQIIILNLIRVLRYILNIKIDDDHFEMYEEYDLILYELNAIHNTIVKGHKKVYLMTRKTAVKEVFHTYEISNFLLCLKYRIFKYKFGIEGFLNTIQHFNSYFQ
ncbi:hypothetical protein CWI38_0212p0040 [Hamiltosporidium tvaerminnensis]|uniref:Uncharacterized protein n=1 Tax=Hamiltosporidium tvaerminnensis TaxID=1176355 RepID=A0A4Q9LZI6_9MICR|nr:hypothetical protein CWI38_0212p0040 [Hamiltosporidium tvaerminnensis]